MKNHALSGGQIRAARALLRWSAEELARRTSLGLNTIKRAEAKDGKTSLTEANEIAVRRAFETAGIEFTNGDQPGVRVTKAAVGRSMEIASVPKPKGSAKAGRKTAEAPKRKR
jgi:transcriptional regulator with XRE-family HTH domain